MTTYNVEVRFLATNYLTIEADYEEEVKEKVVNYLYETVDSLDDTVYWDIQEKKDEQ